MKVIINDIFLFNKKRFNFDYPYINFIALLNFTNFITIIFYITN